MNDPSSAASREFTFQRYDGLDGLERLRESWLNFEARMPRLHFYQTWNWYKCMLRDLATDPDRYLFISVKQSHTTGDTIDEPIVAIFPFQLEVETRLRLTCRILDLPSHPHLLLRDFALHPDASGQQVFAKLLAWLLNLREPGWDVLRFRQIPLRSQIDSLCQSLTGPLGMSQSSGSVAVIDCVESPQQSLSHLSPRFRRNLRRLKRRARRKGGTRFVACRDPESMGDSVRLFCDIEHDSWKSDSGSSIASDRKLINFYTSLAQIRGEGYECQINFLQFGDDTVAAQFGIRSHDIFYVLKIGYRQAFSKIGPGNLLLDEAVRYFSNDQEIKLVNLTTSPEWAEKWKSDSISLVSHSFYRASFAGIVMYLIAGIKGFFRRNTRPPAISGHSPSRRSPEPVVRDAGCLAKKSRTP